MIPAGSFVLINDHSIKLPRNTNVFGNIIFLGGKLVRFDEAPGIAPAGTIFLMEHAHRRAEIQHSHPEYSIAA